jgi:hypothetical protein
VLAWAAPLASVLAFAALFVPGGVTSCSGSSTGGEACRSLPAVTAFSPEAMAIAIVLVALGFAAPLALWQRRRGYAVASAMLQVVPQVISFGGFLLWLPALALTVVAALVVR